jgi:hypothetical protein
VLGSIDVRGSPILFKSADQQKVLFRLSGGSVTHFVHYMKWNFPKCHKDKPIIILQSERFKKERKIKLTGRSKISC